MIDYEIRLQDGAQCLYIFETPGDPGSGQGQANQDSVIALLGSFPPCPNNPVEPGGGLSPYGAAALAWYELVELEDPQLWVAPGRAVTGLPAFLEISGEQTRRVEFGPAVTPGFEVVITATSTYDVDWGDGTVERGIDDQGGPYPDGSIRHNYQHTSADNVISVTQNWKATWTATATSNGQTFAGEFDDAEQPVFTANSLALPIGEIQAVRNF